MHFIEREKKNIDKMEPNFNAKNLMVHRLLKTTANVCVLMVDRVAKNIIIFFLFNKVNDLNQS